MMNHFKNKDLMKQKAATKVIALWDYLREKKMRLCLSLCTAMSCAGVMGIPVYAAETKDPKQYMFDLITQLCKVFPAIGVGLIFVGAFKLFMAFRNDQPDAYSNAIKDVAIGVILIGFSAIWTSLKESL